MVSQRTTRVSFTHTATSDAPFRLTDSDIFYYDATVHCETNDARLGGGDIINQTDGGIVLPADASYWDTRGNLSELYFKNKTAGSNCKITVTATIPSDEARRRLG